MMITAAITSCGSSGKMTQSQEKALGDEIVTPCSDEEFHTDKTTFRATGIGSSLDLTTSKRKANLIASSNLAASVNQLIKSGIERYAGERQIGDKITFTEKYSDMAKQLVNQEINNVAIVCTKTYQKNGKYTTYIAIEVAKSELLNKISSNIAKEAKDDQDFEAYKFQQSLEKEAFMQDK
jgi:phosphopantetheine adenylyltransferase